MSTMYSRSMVMFEQSKEALKRISLDDAYLDAACFETQQAIEFILKAVLLEYGKPYERTHDIRILLSDVLETGFEFNKSESLDILADTVTDWEENSRYGKGIRTTVQTVQRVHNIYKSINESFLKLQEKNNENSENQP